MQNSTKKMRKANSNEHKWIKTDHLVIKICTKKPTPAFQTKQTQTTKKECINYDGYIMMNVFVISFANI